MAKLMEHFHFVIAWRFHDALVSVKHCKREFDKHSGNSTNTVGIQQTQQEFDKHYVLGSNESCLDIQISDFLPAFCGSKIIDRLIICTHLANHFHLHQQFQWELQKAQQALVVQWHALQHSSLPWDIGRHLAPSTFT